MVDASVVPVNNALEKKIIDGVVPELHEGGLAILRYAGDAIFLLDGKLEYAEI